MPKEMINRDPFCDVQLTPVEHRGEATDKVLVEMQNEDGLWAPMGGVSSVHGLDYALVPNRHVYDMVGDILTRADGSFKPVPEYGGGHSKAQHWDGKKFSAKWYSEDIADSVGNSAVALGIEAVNSYDGSAPVGIRFFAMHMICSNQFYMNNVLGNFVFKHVSNDAGIQLQENVDDALKLMRRQADRFMKFLPMMKELCDHKIGGLQGFLDFREKANQACWKSSRDPAVLDELQGCGQTAGWDVPMDRQTPVDSYWRLLNAYTAVSTHYVGGFNGASLSNQITDFTFKHAGIQPPADL